ncbi:putative TetR family transcriptional regulator [Nocardia brasiliensis NBRC 14402]|uniref:TetR/AcrR family transcriptional regulator n=2 Tax=Nocardia brasiliensis TaxID=37326 RepID=UPI0002EA8110|nr:TetR/AcrR family transcriptional regulator [Nocardia brasiliensis]ASF06120.1 TetR/AcrR family transcriptional regulator [Nocardia brasiliensis]GAJ83603.1 putative TetR family transcriptional regulator [Nocardia brasiliensis NBRC 14402]SUB53753.1 division inhibitor protein [Nocardia brasiliensis]
MSTRRRLSPDARRQVLLDAGARLFAERAYDAVLMEDVAAAAGVSRALLYRHFPSKRELFAGVYEQAANQLLVDTPLDSGAPLAEQLAAGLTTHFDYFEANANSVLAANRVLAEDPAIQAIIAGELGELRRRLLEALGVEEPVRTRVSSVLSGWLTFVRVLTVEWLENQHYSRAELLEISMGALLGALQPILGPDLVTAETAAPQ